MIGRTLAQYKILEKIGSGGVGDVYPRGPTREGPGRGRELEAPRVDGLTLNSVRTELSENPLEVWVRISSEDLRGDLASWVARRVLETIRFLFLPAPPHSSALYLALVWKTQIAFIDRLAQPRVS